MIPLPKRFSEKVIDLIFCSILRFGDWSPIAYQWMNPISQLNWTIQVMCKWITSLEDSPGWCFMRFFFGGWWLVTFGCGQPYANEAGHTPCLSSKFLESIAALSCYYFRNPVSWPYLSPRGRAHIWNGVSLLITHRVVHFIGEQVGRFSQDFSG